MHPNKWIAKAFFFLHIVMGLNEAKTTNTKRFYARENYPLLGLVSSECLK